MPAAQKRKRSEPVPKKDDLDFSDEFEVEIPGDVILQAGDEDALCFYMRLSLLSELSSFFKNLPPPSPEDLVEGTALIPLHGTTSSGLWIFLLAIKSLTSSKPFLMSAESWFRGDQLVLEAVVVAKMYETPVVYRLLFDSIFRDAAGKGNAYLEFAIWAIADDSEQTRAAAERTIQLDSIDISAVDRYIVDFCKDHAPLHWLQLSEFHIRRLQVAGHFRMRMIASNEKDPLGPSPCSAEHEYHGRTSNGLPFCRTEKCSEPNKKRWDQVHERLKKIKSLEDIDEARMQGYGIVCGGCRGDVKKKFEGVYKWLENFAGSYTYQENGS